MRNTNRYRATRTPTGVIRVMDVLTGDVQQLSSQAENVLSGRKSHSDLSSPEKKFAGQAFKAGWINAAGSLNGTFIDVPRGPHLKRLQIELSVKCNFACTYCYSESGPTQTASLSPAQIDEVIRTAHRIGVENIDFTGGEVMIYKGWQNHVRLARELGMSVSVHTNGSLLSEKNVLFLRQIGIRCLQVTVESHHADVHEAVGRGPRGSHDRVMKGIERAINAGIRVRLAALVHRKNLAHIQESVVWFYEKFGTSLSLDRVMATGVGGAEPLAVTEAEFWAVVAPLIGTGAASASRICESPAIKSASIEPECGVAHSYVYLTADGHYSLCPTMTHREESQFTGPTVDTCSLDDAWYESDLFTDLRGLNCENTGSGEF